MMETINEDNNYSNPQESIVKPVDAAQSSEGSIDSVLESEVSSTPENPVDTVIENPVVENPLVEDAVNPSQRIAADEPDPAYIVDHIRSSIGPINTQSNDPINQVQNAEIEVAIADAMPVQTTSNQNRRDLILEDIISKQRRYVVEPVPSPIAIADVVPTESAEQTLDAVTDASISTGSVAVIDATPSPVVPSSPVVSSSHTVTTSPITPPSPVVTSYTPTPRQNIADRRKSIMDDIRAKDEINRQNRPSNTIARQQPEAREPAPETVINTDPSRVPVVGSLYSRTHDTTSILPPIRTTDSRNYTMRDIGEIVLAINNGQKELSKIQLYADNKLYQLATDAYNKISRKGPVRDTVYDVFERQLGNVGQLNNSLAVLTTSYGTEARQISETLNRILDSTEAEMRQGQVLKDKVLPVLYSEYKDLNEEYQSLSKDDPQYYNKLRELNNSRKLLKQRLAEYKIVNNVGQHHEKDIENLLLQQDIFENLLTSVMEMAYTTKCYQETLQNNARIWRSADVLKNVIGSVAGGIGVLAEYNKTLNERYTRSVREITDIVKNNPAGKLIETTNSELRMLTHDISQGLYGEQLRMLEEGRQ